jgi:signal peptidase I
VVVGGLTLALFALAIYVVITWYPLFVVSGTAMIPSLEPNDIIVTQAKAKPARGDIVVVRSSVGNYYIKRIIAVDGDIVDFNDEGFIYIDGIRLEEPYVVNEERTKPAISFPYEVPSASVFVLNDNRPIIDDSRDAEFGPVPLSRIAGKAVLRIWPLSGLGTLE